MDLIWYKDKPYPKFQSEGFASQFAIPYAKHFCKGTGFDIGCNRAEWAFPGARMVDLAFDDGFHALNLPFDNADYIFSSHCLEHIPDWVTVLDYWHDSLRRGGTLFLYLPDYSQEYWRPWNNRKHVNIFTPEIIRDYLEDRKFERIYVSGVDLNNAFMVVAEKCALHSE